VLEYCAPIWDPIEMIQHRATRFVLKKPWRRNYQDSVSSMLADLQWPLLSQRRKYARLTLLYKSLNNLLSIPSTYLPVPTPLDQIIVKTFYTTTHQLIVTNSPFSQEQYQSGIISLQELYNVNHLTFLISICTNMLLYNCMIHISPYAPGGLW